MPLAESVVKLNAVCMQCYKEAAYTKRLGAEKEVYTVYTVCVYLCNKLFSFLASYLFYNRILMSLRLFILAKEADSRPETITCWTIYCPKTLSPVSDHILF